MENWDYNPCSFRWNVEISILRDTFFLFPEMLKVSSRCVYHANKWKKLSTYENKILLSFLFHLDDQRVFDRNEKWFHYHSRDNTVTRHRKWKYMTRKKLFRFLFHAQGYFRRVLGCLVAWTWVSLTRPPKRFSVHFALVRQTSVHFKLSLFPQCLRVHFHELLINCINSLSFFSLRKFTAEIMMMTMMGGGHRRRCSPR